MGITAAYKIQKTFSEPLEIQARVNGWKFVLEDLFTVDQVLWALKKFLTTRSEMPVPAEIVKILQPEAPRISETEFIAAQKWQERNNWPIFSDAQDVIDAYRKQEREVRTDYEVGNKALLEMAGKSVKRISREGT